MNIDTLRQKHKAMIVDHALLIYRAPSYARQYWIDFLLSGGNLCEMIDALRQGWQPEQADLVLDSLVNKDKNISIIDLLRDISFYTPNDFFKKLASRVLLSKETRELCSVPRVMQ